MGWWRRVKPAVKYRKALSRARVAAWGQRCLRRWQDDRERQQLVGIKAQVKSRDQSQSKERAQRRPSLLSPCFLSFFFKKCLIFRTLFVFYAPVDSRSPLLPRRVILRKQWVAQKDEIATLRAQLEKMKQMYSEVGKKAGALPEVMGKFSELQSYAKSLKAEYERRIGEVRLTCC